MTGEQDDLSTRLVRSSSEFATSALSAMSDGKPSVVLLHAATALEHLAKATEPSRSLGFGRSVLAKLSIERRDSRPDAPS